MVAVPQQCAFGRLHLYSLGRSLLNRNLVVFGSSRLPTLGLESHCVRTMMVGHVSKGTACGFVMFLRKLNNKTIKRRSF